MLIALIVVLLLLFSFSLYANYVFYQRVSTYEEERDEEENQLQAEFDELINTLDGQIEIVKRVSMTEVASDDPYVRRVVGSIMNARRVLEVVRDKVGLMRERDYDDRSEEN